MNRAFSKLENATSISKIFSKTLFRTKYDVKEMKAEQTQISDLNSKYIVSQCKQKIYFINVKTLKKIVTRN